MSEEQRDNIVPTLIEDEMKSSYLDFAMSVNLSRAIPDVRDGFKPSQRRILVAMRDLNLTPGRPTRKCAKIVGQTIGDYHPHGDLAVYDTLARMAQDFSMRYPMVFGQGNFGSIDGDPPGAMRYTEARMSRLAIEMMEDIDKQTVDFMPNYDESRDEPTVLPGKFPNLLCNGSLGIGVGMASNMPSHNLGEVVDGIVAVIDNPEITIDEISQYIQGPDFATGAIIHGRHAIREYFNTGRGKIKVRALAVIEDHEKSDKETIAITEIPYQVNKSRLIEKIADLVRDKRIQGITDIRDESDRTGMRIAFSGTSCQTIIFNICTFAIPVFGNGHQGTVSSNSDHTDHLVLVGQINAPYPLSAAARMPYIPLVEPTCLSIFACDDDIIIAICKAGID